ncbi:Uncharacterised protein [Streptococcus pyogenes]|uniref:hypothetical protein n=1 Tax=Streptococcus pyogenes TaxID=1314 RepID=UPI0010A14692|nr:hypothetical protein [Streptococcus pyogenes]VGU90736.1 Uncharacterised protein [Streptococcus pyogenes]VHB65965.1 Uncharacterised protein [Streptococcus pyogenes]VHL81789.1 Uncharacterised protein [Streptococcus pyogenes]VHM16013.1 Uncharacterised protein [Streptococcus pyogenes]VHM74427.1 Uncharacterised protein [Streptococcus pyogenes]
MKSIKELNEIANDILVDKETTSAIINTSCSALKCLISDHDKTTRKYRKEL